MKSISNWPEDLSISIAKPSLEIFQWNETDFVSSTSGGDSGFEGGHGSDRNNGTDKSGSKSTSGTGGIDLLCLKCQHPCEKVNTVG